MNTYSQPKKLAAEAFGTFILVFFGCGTAMVTGGSVVPTALAFGLSIVVAAYTIGKISGAHLNPAVSFAMFFDGRMSLNEAIGYTIAQVVGGFCATLCHVILVACGFMGTWEMDDGELEKVKAEVGDTVFGANSFGTMNFFGALLTEIILTTIFILVILAVTQSDDEGTSKHAGLFIGAALVFVHLIGIGMTGTSVNPARSFAPAIFSSSATDGDSLKQLWVFIVGPMAGSFLAAMINSLLIKDKN
ncbi:MAG: aquaporin [Ruminococcus sp.]|nr:aquaporin [Ruminococcus sp.]